MSCRPFVLIVCDGWGENDDAFGNAIAAAATPCMDALRERWPSTRVAASGDAAGLPDGQQGNSEVGHLTIGAGRVVRQTLSRINHDIADGSFFGNGVLQAAVDRARQRGTSLHLLGLVSPGGVHAHQAHAVATARLAAERGLDRIFVHAFLDGRDEPPTSAAHFVADLELALAAVSPARIATVIGRYYAMDRDRRWDRTRRAYELIAGGGAGERTAEAAVLYIEERYAAGETDEFISPAAIVPAGGSRVRIQDGDVAVFFNFRPDRARQLSHALVDPSFEGFARSRVIPSLDMVTFAAYGGDLRVPVAFPKQDVRDGLAEVISNAGLRQFHIAETEKYAHVTYFINGGREQPFPGEERALIPSPRVATYDATPAMSAEAVTQRVLERIATAEDALIVVNFANCDMVGHTGDFPATVAAVEIVDGCVGRVVDAALAAGGAALITADHGNAELKVDRRDNSVLTAHTTSCVPALLCGTQADGLRPGGGLQDIAPTVLAAMGVAPPETMTGRDLALLD